MKILIVLAFLFVYIYGALHVDKRLSKSLIDDINNGEYKEGQETTNAVMVLFWPVTATILLLSVIKSKLWK